MASTYCTNCGAQQDAGASYCSACGSQISRTAGSPGSNHDIERQREHSPETQGHPDGSGGTHPPHWPVVALGLLWVVFLVAFPGMDGIEAAGGLAALSGLAVLASIPLLYVDARNARRANVLDARPILVVLAVFVLYLVTMPVYVGYRVYLWRTGGGESGPGASAPGS